MSTDIEISHADDDIFVSQDEIDAERISYELEDKVFSDSELKRMIRDRKEEDLWRGNKMGREGD